ncbi:alternate-type signal peptide domain-containing protein [Pseudarthrobacter sp. NPDC055928]|uniref:alternate-type signal peptide domain-containing protein n=1 Tax=Pseudarthrobacter sp. NPDC055928 TaxID=3345661 RepID=UPI0035D7B206
MTKGAIVTAAGVMLLIGGGGTLAVWNVEQNAEAGIVASGDLNLVAEAGVWTVAGQAEPIDIDTYLIVPGDTLTYTQNVDITLDGNNISATLSVEDANGVNTGFDGGTYTTSAVTLTKNDLPIANPLSDDVTDAVASVSFDFLTTTDGRDSVDATYDFSAVAFKLVQIAPADPVEP